MRFLRFPPSTPDYIVDGRNRDTVYVGNQGNGNSPLFHNPNCFRTPTIQFSLGVNQKSMLRSMSTVATWSNIFKIIETVVRLFSVFMVRLLSRWHRPNERRCYKSVDKGMFILPISVEHYPLISLPVFEWFQNSVGLPMEISVSSSSVGRNPFYLTKVGDFINSFISDDRFPDFSGRLFGRHRASFSGSMFRAAVTRKRFCGSIILA